MVEVNCQLDWNAVLVSETEEMKNERTEEEKRKSDRAGVFFRGCYDQLEETKSSR